ncbi:MAG: hypothetical protein MSA15_15705 [Clostridium sp.]|nr:hypothetical protein [Clostridium sp.]
MADETKKVFVTKENLQKVLTFLKSKNAELYLAKGAQAASAARVANALKLTVGDQEVEFDGSAEKTATVAAKQHIHETTDITGFDAKVKDLIAGAESTHTHANKAELDKITDGKVAVWDAKIGVEDVAKLKYSNPAMSGVADVKKAIDVLIKNVQIGNAALADATANVNGLADRLTTAEGKVTALEGKVGDDAKGLVKDVADLKAANAEGGAVAEAIKDAKQAGLDAQTAVQAEVTRAQGVENELRADLGQKADEATADTAFGRIAKVKADLVAEAAAARAAEKEAKDAADAAQADVDALEVLVGKADDAKDKDTVFGAIAKEAARADAAEKAVDAKAEANKAAIETLNGDVNVDGSVDKKIKDAIDQVNTAADSLKNRVAANEGKLAVIQGEGEGSIKKAVADLVNGAPEAMDTLKELADSITKHESTYQAYVAQVAKDIAAAKQAAIDKAGELDTTLHTTITGEIATAKSEAISAAAKDASDKDAALENKLQPKIDAKVAQTTYDAKVAALEKADVDNLAAAKEYADAEDAKIEAILGHKAVEGGEAATGLCADVAANAAAIAAEATARQNADKILTDRLDALTGDGADSVAAKVQVVQKALDDHKAAQATKDKAQDDAIDAVEGRLDVLEGGAEVEGSVAKAVADAEGRVKVTTDALGGRIATLETTVGDSNSGLVKDVADLKAINAGTRLTSAEASITAMQKQLANLVPLEDAELQTMLDNLYK